MPSLHDHGPRSAVSTQKIVPPYLLTTTDASRALNYQSADNLLERSDGHIAASIKSDGGTTLTYTVGQLPPHCIVKTVSFSITTGSGDTATPTIAVGISGTTGKYMTATTFASTMDTATVKTVTTLPIHETTARTVLLTLGANTDTALRGAVTVHYIKVPAPLA